MEWPIDFQMLVVTLGKGPLIVLITALAIILGRVVWRQLQIFHCFWTSRRRALSAVAREKTQDGVREGKGLWLQPPSKPENYDNAFGTRVLVVSNNKGGVAKTTLAANLGAYWAKEWKKRVLLIDLDYQGTLSSMALRGTSGWILPGQDSLATRLVSGDLDPAILAQCAKSIPEEQNLKIIPAFYDLAQADNRLIVEWLLRCSDRSQLTILERLGNLLLGRQFTRSDIRYNLAERLQTQTIRNSFDVVIIDCPPRVTISVLQALCASTHILIPTILDQPSAEAAVSFCGELETLRQAEITPKLNYVGIVGTKVSSRVGEIAERRAIDLINDGLRTRQLPTILLDSSLFVRESTAFVNNSEDGIAYLAMSNAARQIQVKEAIGKLAVYVANQIGLPQPQG